ncbi:hypothetical protein DDZ14_05795 [Maritimibacter sp. 55A14]|uniref:capsular polysaccharide export protein, LipB/KpsS family n=1 Tax=Maritimibacter sp. 55A14 TaxID=2174844 RepID=UPI000D619D2E|nr:hypothetical protein [Maritimibacter sp. 55A14]PWE33297.1 hypothetical protein DDZ14_05795 [Maritimibacter sp. 55A14]
MQAEIRFHLPAKDLEGFRNAQHLRIFRRIEEALAPRGAAIRVLPIEPPPQTSPDDGSVDPRFPDAHLHILWNGRQRRHNVLNAALAYIEPYWHLDPRGVLCDSSIAGRAYDPGTVPFRRADPLFQALRRRLVVKRHSRYQQMRAKTPVPEGAIAVFLQGRTPYRDGSAHCSAEEMLRCVARHAGGRPVVVKGHPLGSGMDDIALVADLMAEGHDLHPTDANVHDILAACCVTVSVNSAVAMEGFLHRKPAILFGRSDFHHNAETVRDPAEFPTALDRALTRRGGHAQFIHWYFAQNCLSLHDPDFTEAVLARFAAAGFPAERLGLAPG